MFDVSASTYVHLVVQQEFAPSQDRVLMSFDGAKVEVISNNNPYKFLQFE